MFALAENLRSSTKVLKRDVTPPSFCLPISILSAWRSRKPGAGGREESGFVLVRGNRSVGVAAGEEDPESVRICEKRDCRSFILFLAVDV